MLELTVRKIGNSLGVILPAEAKADRDVPWSKIPKGA